VSTNVAKQIAKSIDIDGYIDRFTYQEEKFTIFFPDGEPIECSRPRRYRTLVNTQDQATEWYNGLKSDFERWREDPNLSARKEINEYIASILSEGETFFELKEVVPAFFVRHFCINPAWNDFQAVKLIGAPSLLYDLYNQINMRLSAGQDIDDFTEVKDQKKDLGETPSISRKLPSVRSSGGTSRASRRASTARSSNA
jgi:hypothetical protein